MKYLVLAATLTSFASFAETTSVSTADFTADSQDNLEEASFWFPNKNIPTNVIFRKRKNPPIPNVIFRKRKNPPIPY